MTVKVKMRSNKMAVVKFTNPADQEYFRQIMLKARDDRQAHPTISIKGADNYEMKPLNLSGPQPSPVQMPQQLTPEMIQKIKGQGMPVSISKEVAKPDEGKPAKKI